MKKKEDSIVTEEHLAALRAFLQKHSGLFFPDLRFRKKLKDITELYIASRQTTFSKFILFLKGKSGEASLTKLKTLFIEEETLFFHTSPPMEALKHNVLPEIIKRNEGIKKITIWSAGCGTGEEPYILALFLKELIEDPSKWDITIIATDSDRRAIKSAKEGRYPAWSFHGVDKKIIGNYFLREGEGYLIEKKYRAMVDFSCHSLNSSTLPGKITKAGGVDLILFRNVSTLLDAKRVRRAAGAFYKVLNRSGFLVTGKNEHSSRFYSKMSSRFFPGSVNYQKSKIAKTGADISAKAPDDIDPIDLVIENETRTLLTVIKENDLSQFKTKDGLSLNENRKGSGKKTEETLIFDQALLCFNSKEFDEAIEYFTCILDINPVNTRACWMLCHIYAMNGLYDEAIAWGTRCIEIDPLNKAPYYTLALSYIGKGRLNEAAEKIKKAIYIDPKFTLGYFTLGNIYILLHLKSQAENIGEGEAPLSSSTLSKELSFKTKSNSVRKLLDELQLKPRSFQGGG